MQLAVYFDQATYDRLLADIPKLKLITVSTVADKLKVNGYEFLISEWSILIYMVDLWLEKVSNT